jgi:hypothetical protein
MEGGHGRGRQQGDTAANARMTGGTDADEKQREQQEWNDRRRTARGRRCVYGR